MGPQHDSALPGRLRKRRARGPEGRAPAAKRAPEAKRAPAKPGPQRGPAAPPRKPAKARRRWVEALELAEGGAEGGGAAAVGDTVYVDLGGAEPLELADEDEEERCEACGGGASARHVMLECDGCLSGWHLHCLRPRLDRVPKGDWLCPRCTGAPGAARPPPAAAPARQRRARELLLEGRLALARVEAVWEEGGEQRWAGRWWYLPQDTHTGRQAHHGAREVFLSSHVDEQSGACALRRAEVLTPAAFARDGAGDDCYLCEYLYDASWKRFRRWDPAEADGLDLAFDPDEEDDEAFDVQAELRAAGAAGQPAGAPRAAAGGANRRHGRAVGNDFVALGSRAHAAAVSSFEVPELRRIAEKGAHGALSRARAALELSAVPKQMPCRERERQEIEHFVREAIVDGGDAVGKSLYISGTPGTGKTATVLEVMRKLRGGTHRDEIPAFQFVEINGLRLPTPHHAYAYLWEALTGQHTSPTKAAEHLDLHFGGGAQRRRAGGPAKKFATVLLVDEMDQLVTRSQSVLYNLFDWPTRAGAGLTVIGIANTLDLPERLLPRIVSRLGLHRLAFQPYTQQQIQLIIRSRLRDVEAFESQTIEYAARKVAAASGDVRRALELCRRAAEIASEDKGQWAGLGSPPKGGGAGPVRVKMRDVDAAVKEMFGSAHIQTMQACSHAEVVLLGVLVLELRASGLLEATAEDLGATYGQLVRLAGEPDVASLAELSRAIARLAASRLVICQPGFHGRLQKVALNVPPEDVAHVVGKRDRLQWLHARVKAD